MTPEEKKISILSEHELFDIKRPIPSSRSLQQAILFKTEGLEQDRFLESGESSDSPAGSLKRLGFELRSKIRLMPMFFERLSISLWGKSALVVAASAIFAVVFVSLSVPPTTQNPSSFALGAAEAISQIDLAELEFQDSMLLGNELLFEML